MCSLSGFDLVWFLILQNFMEYMEVQYVLVMSLIRFFWSWAIVLGQSCLFFFPKPRLWSLLKAQNTAAKGMTDYIFYLLSQKQGIPELSRTTSELTIRCDVRPLALTKRHCFNQTICEVFNVSSFVIVNTLHVAKQGRVDRNMQKTSNSEFLTYVSLNY